ncbi:internal scaffolding protein [Sigmofec virus UA08Rod_6251]|uniref:Internal scaffolding protein n=1 Tax=Sigmofec virus UA08Rod_6251 TaxID=2929226 RepID=A0A976N182_9VIRU|nr:internal scaffolding protein [Sigmofec virus UA08Rod_6251]
MKVGTVQRDSSEFFKTFIPNSSWSFLRKKTSSEIRAYNPVITDQTQRKQTDLAHILQSNPDVSGLSLLLDDKVRQEKLQSISVEDFLEPKDHYDIFDIYEFVENAKYSFNSLPVKFRMQYDNDPMKFLNAVNNESTSSKTLAALSDALNIQFDALRQEQRSETSSVTPLTPDDDVQTNQTNEKK